MRPPRRGRVAAAASAAARPAIGRDRGDLLEEFRRRARHSPPRLTPLVLARDARSHLSRPGIPPDDHTRPSPPGRPLRRPLPCQSAGIHAAGRRDAGARRRRLDRDLLDRQRHPPAAAAAAAAGPPALDQRGEQPRRNGVGLLDELSRLARAHARVRRARRDAACGVHAHRDGAGAAAHRPHGDLQLLRGGRRAAGPGTDVRRRRRSARRAEASRSSATPSGAARSMRIPARSGGRCRSTRILTQSSACCRGVSATCATTISSSRWDRSPARTGSSTGGTIRASTPSGG